jgi:hypothetical protein
VKGIWVRALTVPVISRKNTESPQTSILAVGRYQKLNLVHVIKFARDKAARPGISGTKAPLRGA